MKENKNEQLETFLEIFKRFLTFEITCVTLIFEDKRVRGY